MSLKWYLFFVFLSFYPASAVHGQECPPYFVDHKTTADSKSLAVTVCRYHGPYPMGPAEIGNWQNLPYVPFLEAGIPLTLIELGRRLFFDPNLSLGRNLSCAHCHDPDKAFTDQKELAVNGSGHILKRNTPTLLNVVFLKRFFWDGRSYSLFDQAFHPLFDPNEMDLTPDLLVERIRADKGHLQAINEVFSHPSYASFDQKVQETYSLSSPVEPLSAKLFKSEGPKNQDPSAEQIILRTVSLALVGYQATLLSFDSPFDRWFLGQTPSLPPSQWRGYNVFRSFVTRCAECHIPPLFTSRQLVVIGAPAHPKRKHDFGEYLQNPDRLLKGSFKVPTLRNVTITGPYMHSGALGSLKQVVDFYHRGEGRQNNGELLPGLHWHIRPLELSNAEKKDLEHFLEALTDPKYDPKNQKNTGPLPNHEF
jgi:cytochrome c peroxidase